LLGTPVVLVGHPGMLRVGYHRVELGAFSACLCAVLGEAAGHRTEILVGHPGSTCWAPR